LAIFVNSKAERSEFSMVRAFALSLVLLAVVLAGVVMVRPASAQAVPQSCFFGNTYANSAPIILSGQRIGTIYAYIQTNTCNRDYIRGAGEVFLGNFSGGCFNISSSGSMFIFGRFFASGGGSGSLGGNACPGHDIFWVTAATTVTPGTPVSQGNGASLNGTNAGGITVSHTF
jgi:hypothetical protein